MKPSSFQYHAPTTVPHALELLAHHGEDAKALAGGQSLIPVLAMRLSRFDHLVDLGRVAGLRGVRATDSGLRIGAMTTQADVLRHPRIAAVAPLVTRATRLIGHFQIRNRGTIGGSVAHADPAAEYPAVLRALDATLEIAGPGGTRLVGAADFFVATWETVVAPDELLVGVHVPDWGPGCGFAVEEVARRHGDFAMAGVTCGVRVADGTVTRAAFGLFGVGSTPLRAAAAERALLGTRVDALDPDAIGELAVADLDPPGDLHASGALRARATARLVASTLRAAVKEATDA